MAALRQFASEKAKTVEELVRDALAFYVGELLRVRTERHSFTGPEKSDQKDLSVRQAYIPPDLTYETMSDLGRKLFDLSREYRAAGEKLYNEEELERELARRKGGYIPDEDYAEQNSDVR
jgi:hypothetical protein